MLFDFSRQPYLDAPNDNGGADPNIDPNPADPVDPVDPAPTDPPSDPEPKPEPFLSIKYNKDEVPLTKEEAVELAQKGKNYEKAIERAKQEAAQPARDAYIAEQGYMWNGKPITTEAEYKQALKWQQEAERYATEKGVTPEEAHRELEKDRRLQDLETETKLTKRLLTLDQEKKPLKDKVYFSELEPEIDQLVTENAKKGIDISVEAAYYYLRGQRLEELIGQEKGKAVKSTLANVQDRLNRGLTSGSEGAATDVDVPINSDMAAAFGNDPKRIAKYVKDKIKSRS